MTLFSRLSFHQRIFLLVGQFAVVSVAVMWFAVRPLYERQVVEERITVVQQLQHFASHRIDEQLSRWIDVTEYLGWNLQTRTADVEVLIRQQIAFDSSVTQIVLSSPNLAEDFVATSTTFPTFSFQPPTESWTRAAHDTSVFVSWSIDPKTERPVFAVRKPFRVGEQHVTVTLFADASALLKQLDRLPIGGTFAVQVGDARGMLYSTADVTFPLQKDSWENLTVMKDATARGTEWKLLYARFSTLPMYLLIAIPQEVIVAPVHRLLTASLIVILVLALLIAVAGWSFSRQLTRPVTALVADVERLKSLDFSTPVSIPSMHEIAHIATTVESMRTVLERYQRINVEKIILEEWKNKFFLSHSEDGICITDGDGFFTFTNDTFDQVTAMLAPARPVTVKTDLTDHPSIDHSKESSREETTGDYTVTFHQREIKVSAGEEEPRYFRLHDVAIERSSERLGSLMVLHDLTNDRMIDKMKTEMMNFIVHELRNPLNSIMGFASFIAEEPEMGLEERTEYLRIIQESSRTMNQLVNRFLDVQRLESKRVDYHKEETDLVAMAKTVCDSQKPQLAAKSIALTFTAEPGIPSSIVAPDLMREAFLNLVSNAIKYGDENRTIEVEMKKEESAVMFVITDHGYGISAEDQQKLFSKFFRVTSNKKAAGQIGTGLGLAHVKEVMTFHNGTVALESNAAIGCRFTLTIPIVTA